MDLLKQLKNLLKIPGNRVIIVEEGKPAYVMTTIEDYLKLVRENNPVDTGLEPVSTNDEEIEDWREQVNRVLTEVAEKESVKKEPEIEEEETEETEAEMEELKVEDLPF